MARKAIGIQIEGMEELTKTLTGLLPREAKNLARATVHALAGKVRDDIKRGAPVATGRLRKSIVAVRRRGTPTQVASDVLVKGDAFYWRFIEFGSQKQSERPFINPAVERARPNIPEDYRKLFGVKLEKALARRAKKLK